MLLHDLLQFGPNLFVFGFETDIALGYVFGHVGIILLVFGQHFVLYTKYWQNQSRAHLVFPEW